MSDPSIKVGSLVKTPGGREGDVRRIEYRMALVWERRPPNRAGSAVNRWYTIDELTYLGETATIAIPAKGNADA